MYSSVVYIYILTYSVQPHVATTPIRVVCLT
jgi:hypothetical protein